MSTAQLFDTLIAPEDMQTIDQIIRSKLQSEVALVRQVAEYIISSGGKRLRPALTLLSGRALGYEDIRLFELAAMVELIHTATLLHDDVVDESSLRRGQATANELFGNASSILVGDFLYTRAFQIMVSTHNIPILGVMAEATNMIAEGEVLQLLNIGNTDISETQYLQVIEYKTAKLFEAACQVGALIANASEQQVDAMAHFGRYIGTAFQIVDDILDYTGNTEHIGKQPGDDLAEGKPTLPLIYAMRHGTPEQSSLVREALKQTSRQHFQSVVTAVQTCGALDYAYNEAKKATCLAIQALQTIPDSSSKQALIKLAQSAIQRDT